MTIYTDWKKYVVQHISRYIWSNIIMPRNQYAMKRNTLCIKSTSQAEHFPLGQPKDRNVKRVRNVKTMHVPI